MAPRGWSVAVRSAFRVAVTILALVALVPFAHARPQAALAPLARPGPVPQEGGRITATPQCPTAPDGFVVELVAKAPEIKWPSAVHCLDDGSLLVAEDPMDMPGPSDQPLDKIWELRFRQDGSFTKTLFADHLYAVMGIQQIDDAVYVMNMPHLTILKDKDGDGVADSREDLFTDLGPVAPGWPGGFNDHIVSGVRLGMDGWLYVSVGDKGIPHAHGKDGSELTLHGGGVVRVAPSSGRIELVASGTRNHLDVCMDEHDHIFTYDNTDDGLGWWTRFSHIMPTGYYGYPYDYHDHPERMLPCMRDEGGGSGVGGLCYREDAWPPEFRGDVYCCDWARQLIRRFRVERDGASYRCTEHEEWITAGGSGEFHPLDLCESPDGQYLYLADWNHPGWMVPDVAGRVWRIRRRDDRPGEPWRSHKLLEGGLRDVAGKLSDDDLVANLGHPSFNKRLAAQRELSRRLEREPERKTAVARQIASSPDERVRRHLVWALANSGAMNEEMLLATLRASAAGEESVVDGDTRAEIVRALGQRRTSDMEFVSLAGRLLVHDPDPMVRRECAIALGRSGDPHCVTNLISGLDATEDLFVRFAIRQAIRALPCDWELLITARSHLRSEHARRDVVLALREIYDIDLVRCLGLTTLFGDGSRLSDKLDSEGVIEPDEAVDLLAAVARKPPPWDGKWWQTQPAKSPPPAKTVEWEGTGFITVEIGRALDHPRLAMAALHAEREMREPSLVPKVVALLAPANAENLRGAAVETLFAIEGDASLKELAPLLNDASAAVRVAVVTCYGSSGLKSVTEPLAPLVADPATREAAIAALARHPDASALPHYLAGLASPGPLHDSCRQALVALKDEVRGAVEAMQTRKELSELQLAEMRELYSRPQPILKWSLLGPFDRQFRLESLELTPADRVAAAFAAPVTGKDGKRLEVKEAPAAPPDGLVDLLATVVNTGSVCAYAVARFDSPVARKAKLWIGSDDGVIAWLNGVKIEEKLVDRGWTPDEDKLEVPLVAGTNVLLLRIDQAGGDWRFNVKVSDPPSGPLFEGIVNDASAAPAADVPFDAPMWRDYALAHAGDAARGRTIFFAEKGPGCFKCHAIAGVGPKVGPDLRDVGAKYPRAELITSVLDPSNRILDGYQATNFFLKNGDVVTGLVTSEKEGVVTVVDATAVTHELRAADISDRKVSKVSAMPTGVADGLTREQFADLIAWVESLKK